MKHKQVTTWHYLPDLPPRRHMVFAAWTDGKEKQIVVSAMLGDEWYDNADYCEREGFSVYAWAERLEAPPLELDEGERMSTNHARPAVWVRIDKAEKRTYWYAELTGRIFEVYDDRRDYILKEDYDNGHRSPWRHLSKTDCTIVSGDVKQSGRRLQERPRRTGRN